MENYLLKTPKKQRVVIKLEETALKLLLKMSLASCWSEYKEQYRIKL